MHSNSCRSCSQLWVPSFACFLLLAFGRLRAWREFNPLRADFPVAIPVYVLFTFACLNGGHDVTGSRIHPAWLNYVGLGLSIAALLSRFISSREEYCQCIRGVG